eukprot:COSAG02_NODE_22934_length_735_cov_1.301887_1_plen_179_part_01
MKRASSVLAGLIAVLAGSSIPAVCAWTGTIAYTSFEEPGLALDTGAGYRDPRTSDADHELSNGAGHNQVQYTACTNGMAELGFRTHYLDLASNVAEGPLFVGEAHLGVVGDSSTAGHGAGTAPDGSQFFMLEGVGGFVYVELEQTSIVEYSGAVISCWVHVESTNWEANDYLKVWADSD